MGFRHRIREKFSTATLRRKSAVDSDATSIKTAPLGRTRTNSSASIPEHLRHTRSIPSSLKTLFTGHSHPPTETSTLGPPSIVGGTRGSSLEKESSNPGPTPPGEKTEAAGATVPGERKEASAEAQSSRQIAAEEAPKPQVYPESEDKFSEGPPEAAHHQLAQLVEVKLVEPRPVTENEPEVVRPVIHSPVRSQPQEAYSYPAASVVGARPAAPRRKTSEVKTKNVPPQPQPEPEERSRGLDDAAPPTGLKMKLKLAWMGLKAKAKK